MTKSKSTPTSLTILRGTHNIHTVDYVMPYIHPSSILFVELVATDEQKAMFRRWANDITLKQNKPGQWKVEQWTSDQNNCWIPLVQRLENSGVLVRPVDRSYDNSFAIQEYLDSLTIVDLSEALHSPRTEAYTILHRSVQEKTAAAASSFIERDRLVATQVTGELKLLRSDYPTTSIHGVLVQGYMHRSRPYIAKSMPDLLIDEHTYDEASVKQLLCVPHVELVEAKLAAPDKPLQESLIDRVLLTILKYEALAIKEHNTSALRAQDPVLNQRVIDRIEPMDELAIHTELMELLKQYQEKSFRRAVRQSAKRIARFFGKEYL